jgi:hypothetical protein
MERLKTTKHVPPSARVWYRGQTTPYFLNRPPAVSQFLYGVPTADEPSLPGAAPRRNWNYLKVHSFLSVMLQGYLYQQGTKRGQSTADIRRRWLTLTQTPGEWDLCVMLLAQHYGIPTHGIDITDDIDVATWFATNKFTSVNSVQICATTAGTKATYVPLEPDAWAQAQNRWPVIYAFLPVAHSLDGAIREVTSLDVLEIEALRPKHQRAAFFMGAHGLHRNRLAEGLVCAMRLQPGPWTTRSTYRTLFPGIAEDPMYAWMLDLKHRYPDGEIGRFLQEIPEYAES